MQVRHYLKWNRISPSNSPPFADHQCNVAIRAVLQNVSQISHCGESSRAERLPRCSYVKLVHLFSSGQARAMAEMLVVAPCSQGVFPLGPQDRMFLLGSAWLAEWTIRGADM